MDENNIWSETVASSPYAFSVPKPTTLSIFGAASKPLVSISMTDGSMQFFEDYRPDVAAQAFWTAISSEYQEFLKWKADRLIS